MHVCVCMCACDCQRSHARVFPWLHSSRLLMSRTDLLNISARFHMRHVKVCHTCLLLHRHRPLVYTLALEYNSCVTWMCVIGPMALMTPSAAQQPLPRFSRHRMTSSVNTPPHAHTLSLSLSTFQPFWCTCVCRHLFTSKARSRGNMTRFQ